MRNRSAFALAASFLALWCAVESTPETEILTAPKIKKDNVVAIQSIRDAKGDWLTTTDETFLYEPNRTTVELKRRVIECDGTKITQIKVTVRGPILKSNSPRKKRLLFHRTGGKHIVVSNDGTTAQRINEMESYGYGGVLTNRPLMNDEMFEVRLDVLSVKYDDSLGIGVTHHPPDVIDYLDEMTCGTIILYNQKVYENGDIIKRRYGTNLRALRVGDRVGLMKKRNGQLHFFINGIDQGVAKSSVTRAVYGVLDLYGKAVQATIISPEE